MVYTKDTQRLAASQPRLTPTIYDHIIQSPSKANIELRFDVATTPKRPTPARASGRPPLSRTESEYIKEALQARRKVVALRTAEIQNAIETAASAARDEPYAPFTKSEFEYIEDILDTLKDINDARAAAEAKAKKAELEAQEAKHQKPRKRDRVRKGLKNVKGFCHGFVIPLEGTYKEYGGGFKGVCAALALIGLCTLGFFIRVIQITLKCLGLPHRCLLCTLKYMVK
jgi:hypothetical protein